MRCNILRHIVLCWPAVWKTRLTKLFSTTVGTVWCLAAANAVTWKTLSHFPGKGLFFFPRTKNPASQQFNFRKYFLDADEAKICIKHLLCK